MKIGYSNFLQEYVPAEQVDYGDCKTFQIVCPNCREAVFKVARDVSGTQYLAHYRASKAQVAECELRVAALSKREVAAQNIIAHGQHLKLFHAVLRRALLDRAASANWSPETLDKTIAQMVKRPTYRKLVMFAREQAKKEDTERMWKEHEAEYLGKSPYYKQTQLKYAKDMFAYLIAPNSFSLFSFAISLAVIISMGLLTRGERAHDRVFHNVIGALIGGSDRDVQKLEKSEEHRLMLLSTMLAASLATRSWLVTLPYIDIVKQHMDDYNETP